MVGVDHLFHFAQRLQVVHEIPFIKFPFHAFIPQPHFLAPHLVATPHPRGDGVVGISNLSFSFERVGWLVELVFFP